MIVALGSDHRGFSAKQRLTTLLQQLGHTVRDFGPCSAAIADYPDFAFGVALAVSSGDVDYGILICGTGIGMCIAANKVPGVRAAPCHDQLTAEMSRRHNDANIMCLSADLIGEDLMDRMVQTWLSTNFEGGRHARRLEKIFKFEAELAKAEAND